MTLANNRDRATLLWVSLLAYFPVKPNMPRIPKSLILRYLSAEATSPAAPLSARVTVLHNMRMITALPKTLSGVGTHTYLGECYGLIWKRVLVSSGVYAGRFELMPEARTILSPISQMSI